MIKVEVKQHDKYSIEFKSGISITNKDEKGINDFMINTWIFLPSSLDINRTTYSKEQFYKDIKTNLRLITPIYSLKDILTKGKGPFPRLRQAIDQLFANPEDESLTEKYGYQIKMLMCILKSAIRRETELICNTENAKKTLALLELCVADIRDIKDQYRSLSARISNDVLTVEQRQMFLFGDEFLGDIIEQHAFRILRRYKKEEIYHSIRPILTQLIKEEIEHKQAKGFMILDPKDDKRNSLVIIQRNMLKKFIESDLFLQVVKKIDGAFAKQFYYGMAAAIAMVFATVISFIATQRYGNFTTDLFVILVISYVFKDRIKEVMRYYFSSTMTKKYFDSKLNLSIRNQEIGSVKESFDFVSEDKMTQEIRTIRNRSPIVEAENKVYGEKIILYRKLVTLSYKEIERYKEYRLTGINDITRLNLLSFIQKMDNPSIPLYKLDEYEGHESFEGTKVYPLVFIIQYNSQENEYYQKYRLLFNKNGITDIKELN